MAIRLDQIDFGTVSSDEMLVIENGRLKLASQSASTAVQAVASLPPASTATGKLVFDTSVGRLAVSDGSSWKHLSSSVERPHSYAVYKFAGYTGPGGGTTKLPLVPVVEDTDLMTYDPATTELTVHKTSVFSVWTTFSIKVDQFWTGPVGSFEEVGVDLMSPPTPPLPDPVTICTLRKYVRPPAPTLWTTASGGFGIEVVNPGRKLYFQLVASNAVTTAVVEANSGSVVFISEA